MSDHPLDDLHADEPPASNPPWDDWRVTAYVLDELDEAARAAFERRLAADPQLQQAVADVSRITRAVTASLGRESIPTLSEDQRTDLLSQISGESPMNAPAPTQHVSRRTRTGLGLAVAASVCLAVGGTAWLALRSEPLQLVQQSRVVVQAEPDADVASAGARESGARESGARESGARDSRAQSDFARRAENANMETVGADAQPVVAADPTPAEPASRAEPWAWSATAGPPPADAASQLEGVASDGYGGQGKFRQSPSRAPSEGQMMGMGVWQVAGEGQEGHGYGPSAYGVQADSPSGGMGGRPAMRATAASGEPHERYLRERELPRMSETLNEYRPNGYYYPNDEGRGPGQAGDRFEPLTDNPFLRVTDSPLSTFSIDVDTASYSKVRQYLLEQNSLPRPDAVRIEELINYFDYHYASPSEEAEHPFAASIAFASCPWNPVHRLARIGIQGRVMHNDRRPPSNLVFLLDVSGSMNQPNRLPLVRRGMQMLLEQLGENDRVAIVVYAGAAGMVLESTPANQRQRIYDALERLQAGGSTNGGEGIQMAYAIARDHFINGGTNRVILCTDGDFNVGTTGTDQLVRMVEEEARAGVSLTVLGFGMGNHNDAMLEKISGRGNGNYAFIDTASEARKVLVEQTSGTLVTIAKDVKIQVEFNPRRVSGYRLIGYENRLLAKEDFNDDMKDAGEIGAGHSVTALYELIPAGESVAAAAPRVDPLRYQVIADPATAAESDELLTLKMRYKHPDGDRSTLVQFPAEDSGRSLAAADQDFRFATAVAGFGMLLRNSPYKGNWNFAAVEETASEAQGTDTYGVRAEFLRMVRKAAELADEPRNRGQLH